MQSKSILSLVAASLMLSSLTSFAMRNTAPHSRNHKNKAHGLTGIEILDKYMKAPSLENCGIAFMIFSAYQLYSRSSVNEDQWKSRFDVQKLKNIKNIADKSYWKNIWYLFQDEWIGQCYKSKAIKLDPAGDHRLQIHPSDCYPHGFCGNLDAQVKTFGKSMEGLSNILLTCLLLKQYQLVGPMIHKLNVASKDAPKYDAGYFQAQN